MVALRIRALGPLEVIVNGMPVAVGAGKPRIVLGCLALRANRVVTTGVLIEAIWGDRVPANPSQQLQVYLSNLRRLIDPHRSKGTPSQRLASRSGGYLLNVGETELDLLQFRSQVATGALMVQSGDLEGGAQSLRQAVELFTGPVFPDLADIQMFRAELDELQESRLGVQQDLVDIELALGRHAAIVGELRALVAQEPYRERLWMSLVLALYRSDRQADALAACRDLHRIFVENLGIDPCPRLQQLELSVLRQDASLAAPDAGGHRSPVGADGLSVGGA